MFKAIAGFSGLSVDDLPKAKKFYSATLGLKVESGKMGLKIHLPSGGTVYVYQKDNHEPATFTVLNLVVDDIDASVDALSKKGVKFEHYSSGQIKTDSKGTARGKSRNMGPDIAWLRDPAGNFVSIIEE